MKTTTIAVLLLALCGPAMAGEKMTREEISMYNKRENWHTMKMEATAIMGEIKYQSGSVDEARDTFRDSLNTSTKLIAPGSQVMGLDLYRSAEIMARKGDYAGARERLEILISRYPDTEFARKAQDLLAALPRRRAYEGDDDEATPVVDAELPEIILARLQSCLRDGKDQEALENAVEFLQRYPAHKSAEEALLAAAAMRLKLGSPERAAADLRELIAKSSNAELRARAVHLLGAADVAQGDYEDALTAVPALDPGKSWSPWIARAQLWRAAALDHAGRRGAAQALYAKLAKTVERSPVRAYALAGLASDEAKAGKLALAQKDLQGAADEAQRWELSDLEAASKLSAAHLMYRRKLFAEAAAAYGDFVARHPQDPLTAQALFQQGLAFKRLHRGHDAVASFSRLVQEAPDSAYAADAHLQLGQLYDGLGARAAAISQYEEMARTGQKSEAKESLLLRAQVEYNGKRYKQAIPLYWEFLKQYPDDARVRQVQDLLLTSYWMGDRDNPDMARALALYPGHAIVKHARWELGVRAYQRKDWQKAEELFALYAADYPKAQRAPDALFFQGEALMKLGQSDAAAQAYRAFLARFPKHEKAGTAAVRLGAALYEAKDFDGSASAYARAAARGGRGASDALYSQGLSQLKGEDKPAALSTFESFLKRFPDSERASSVWFETGRLREALGRPADAAFAYAHVGASDPNRVEALFQAARLREKLKQTDLAVRNYTLLKAARPSASPLRLRGLLRLGLIFELKGKPAKAMPLYAEILRLAPHDGKDYEAARRRVESLNARGLLSRR